MIRHGTLHLELLNSGSHAFFYISYFLYHCHFDRVVLQSCQRKFFIMFIKVTKLPDNHGKKFLAVNVTLVSVMIPYICHKPNVTLGVTSASDNKPDISQDTVNDFGTTWIWL